MLSYSQVYVAGRGPEICSTAQETLMTLQRDHLHCGRDWMPCRNALLPGLELKKLAIESDSYDLRLLVS